MLNLDRRALRALAAVLRSGSFERAAAEIGVTPSAVSQRIAGLEEQVGTALVIRGRPCTATDAGARLARHASEVELLEAALARDLGQSGRAMPALRIAVNADSLATWAVPALAALEGVLFDVVIDDQDHSADWLRRGEVSAAVTSVTSAVPGCDLVALGALRYVATASAAFARRWFPDGPTAAALAAAPALTFDAKDRLQRDWAEAVAGARVPLRTHLLPSSSAFVEATLLGLGWGLNPEPLVRRHLQSGALVPLAETTLDTPLALQWNRLLAEPLGPLRAAIRRAAATVLIAGG